MIEIWKEIPDYEGLYQVSNLGQIKSLGRITKGRNNSERIIKSKILKLFTSKQGYLSVNLYSYGSTQNKNVHQLVAIAFLNHTPNGVNRVVDHINDDPLDNRVENLQIVSQRFNCRKTQGNYTSKYKGVYWNKKAKKWRGSIMIDKMQTHLGFFKNEYDAHLAYEKALQELVN
jgi:hypothetical protein